MKENQAPFTARIKPHECVLCLPMLWSTRAIGDEVVFSAGSDGNIYGWPVSKENRIDVISANNRSSAILGITVDCPNLMFPKTQVVGEDEDGDGAGGGGGGMFPHNEHYNIIYTTNDSLLKIPEWSLEGRSPSRASSTVAVRDTGGTRVIAPSSGELRVYVTALCLTEARTHGKRQLYAGTSCGSVRIYAWPPEPDAHEGIYYESYVHCSPVVAIRESPQGDMVISAAEDGSVYVHTLDTDIYGAAPVDDDDDAKPPIVFNSDVVLMSVEDVDEHVNEVVALQKTLQETKAKFEFKVSAFRASSSFMSFLTSS